MPPGLVSLKLDNKTFTQSDLRLTKAPSPGKDLSLHQIGHGLAWEWRRYFSGVGSLRELPSYNPDPKEPIFSHKHSWRISCMWSWRPRFHDTQVGHACRKLLDKQRRVTVEEHALGTLKDVTTLRPRNQSLHDTVAAIPSIESGPGGSLASPPAVPFPSQGLRGHSLLSPPKLELARDSVAVGRNCHAALIGIRPQRRKSSAVLPHRGARVCPGRPVKE